MKVYAEASDVCREGFDSAVERQVLIYETSSSSEQQWVQLTYESLRDENGNLIANFDADSGVWLIQSGEFQRHIASDLIVTT